MTEPTPDPPAEVPTLEHARPADVIAALGFDPDRVSAVILSEDGVHAIAATLVEPPSTPTEEATDADT